MKNDVKPVLKVFLADPGGHGKPFCGPGMIRLLDGIAAGHTVRATCANMGMSYSKGWKLLRTLETCAGFPVTARQQGGRGGGETRLTPKGAAFLKTFHEFEDACCRSVESVYARYRQSGGFSAAGR